VHLLSHSSQKHVITVVYVSFENGLLRRIFEPKRDETTGRWRRLHNEELYVLF
jgi:hypothetical protein